MLISTEIEFLWNEWAIYSHGRVATHLVHWVCDYNHCIILYVGEKELMCTAQCGGGKYRLVVDFVRVLFVRRLGLKSICCLIGSQCKCFEHKYKSNELILYDILIFMIEVMK